MPRGRKPLHSKAMTAAEKQRRYRERQKAKLETLAESHVSAAAASELREQIKQELTASWEPEGKAEYLAAMGKKGRTEAKKAENAFSRGRIVGVCSAADFFVGKDRADIAKHLLEHFMIDRETAKDALEADKRTNSITLESLDRARAWEKPPPFLK